MGMYDLLEEEHRCEDCAYGSPRDQGKVKMICTRLGNFCYMAGVNKSVLRQCPDFLPFTGDRDASTEEHEGFYEEL